MSIVRRVLPLGGLIVLLWAVDPAIASDAGQIAGEARQLADRGDAMFRIGRPADGIALLQAALALQTDQRGRPFGYARWIFFRLAQYKHSQGQRSEAERLLVKALAVDREQRLVDKRHLVSQHDAFIVQNYPRVAGISTKRVSPTRIFPVAERLRLAGHLAYGYSDHTLFSYDRRRQTLMVVHDEAGDRIAGFDSNADGDTLLIAYGTQPQLHVVRLAPLSALRIALTLPVKHAFLDAGGRTATLYRTTSDGFRVARLSLDRYASETPLFAGRDQRLLFGRPEFALSTIEPKGVPRSLYLLDVFKKEQREVFRFARSDPRNALKVVDAGGDYAVIAARDGAAQKRSLVVYDQRQPGSHFSGSYDVPLRWSERAVALSPRGDYLVLVSRLKGTLRVLRYSLRLRRAREVAVLRSRSTLPVHGLGVLKDNATIWLHRGATIHLIHLAGKQRTLPLRSLTHAVARWNGRDVLAEDSNELFIGYQGRDARASYATVELKALSPR